MSTHVVPCEGGCGRQTFNDEPLCIDCSEWAQEIGDLGLQRCPECGQVRYQDGTTDIDERVLAGMKCGPCAYGG